MTALPLKGRVALVTGAASGIGRAIASSLAGQGAVTIFADYQHEQAERAAAEAGHDGCHAARIDVSDPAAWSGLVAGIEADHDRLDILVNSAGAYLVKPIEQTSFAEWQRVIDVNLGGIFHALKYAAPLMARGDAASIVNIASTLGVRSRAAMGTYGASKAGVISLTRSAAVEFARKGWPVRVNAVCPGPTETPIIDTLDAAALAAIGGREGMLARVRQTIPLGRLAVPQEIADAVLFLISGPSAFITGSCLMADGGQSA